MQDANTDVCMPAEMSLNECDSPSSDLDQEISRVFRTKVSVGAKRQLQTSAGDLSQEARLMCSEVEEGTTEVNKAIQPKVNFNEIANGRYSNDSVKV